MAAGPLLTAHNIWCPSQRAPTAIKPTQAPWHPLTHTHPPTKTSAPPTHTYLQRTPGVPQPAERAQGDRRTCKVGKIRPWRQDAMVVAACQWGETGNAASAERASVAKPHSSQCSLVKLLPPRKWELLPCTLVRFCISAGPGGKAVHLSPGCALPSSCRTPSTTGGGRRGTSCACSRHASAAAHSREGRSAVRHQTFTNHTSTHGNVQTGQGVKQHAPLTAQLDRPCERMPH